ncbi:nucleotidyltransferase domain-containing protein [Blautia coccoides]|uniref:SMODS domain-containing nucleotidyltransferase n=1 Tax=Blautia producta TaxID=33035 RepID=UPI0028A3128C|nr:nucleotidyltransferase domain-containing protein [Blautia coccoides]MDT4376944.1 nucleotidyltransferase domain-containing protein [Blautia coccoides]
MSVNSYLQNLASELVLSSNEKSSISTSVDTIKTRIDYYFNDVNEKKLFGSYVRGTILPRKADSNSDIDLMIVFNNPNGYKPQTFFNYLKAFAEKYYSTSEIYQSSPTIVLELNHIKFELTPAYKSYGSYYIPDTQSDWMYTDPDGFYDSLTDSNVNNAYKIKPIVRLLKHWNIQKNYRDMYSFELEKQIAEKLKYSYISCTSYTEYLKKGLSEIKYRTDYNRVNKAIAYIDKALEYENDNMPYSALAEIKKAFPEV